LALGWNAIKRIASRSSNNKRNATHLLLPLDNETGWNGGMVENSSGKLTLKRHTQTEKENPKAGHWNWKWNWNYFTWFLSFLCPLCSGVCFGIYTYIRTRTQDTHIHLKAAQQQNASLRRRKISKKERERGSERERFSLRFSHALTRCSREYLL